MQKRRYWFEAKADGFGWGWPLAWQGWAVYAVVALLLVLGFFLFPPAASALAFAAFNGGVILALLLVCWFKGQPLGMR
ncbi:MULTISPECIES: hypothetical protein [unclassified Stenotrophomonas]|uniref:hypothetical protein n=1 Tax=unclassified Stenotrophomonas TaxID=196198 RepID=UPI0025EAD324|nr:MULTISPECIES: hypothetical protein [unclassified Stenotrophomonas]